MYYDTPDTKWKFGIRCDQNGGDDAVEFDVAVHTYIMGFHFVADTKSVGSELSVKAEYNGFVGASAPVNKYELAFYDLAGDNEDRDGINDEWVTNTYGTSPYTPYAIRFVPSTTVGGPSYDIDNQGEELRGIKLAIVLSVINPLTSAGVVPDNGFGA